MRGPREALLAGRSRSQATRSTQGWMRAPVERRPATPAGSPTCSATAGAFGALQSGLLRRSRRGCGRRCCRQRASRSPRRAPATGASARRNGATTRTTTICTQSYLLASRLSRGAGRELRARARRQGAPALRGAAVDRRAAARRISPPPIPRRCGQAIETQRREPHARPRQPARRRAARAHQPERRGGFEVGRNLARHAGRRWCSRTS